MQRSHLGFLGGGLELDDQKRRRVEELGEQLAEHRARYYEGRPAVSDAAYDALEDELRKLDPTHPLLAKVGAPAAAEYWDKAPHIIPMGSLNKASSPEELREWLERCDELLGKDGLDPIDDDLYVTEKLDGLSLELIYRDGRFADGITRGDGDVGERITANVARMRGVPKRIRREGTISVRGEIILRLADKRAHFADYTSPRNAAAGTARRLDGIGNEHLTVVCYDLAPETGLGREVEKLALLRELGFATPASWHGDAKAVLEIHDEYTSGRRTSLDYEIDGLVVRANSLAAQHALGDLNRRPRGAVAFKFPSPVKLSVVRELRWDTGPSGRVTPVATVDPVELAGAMVRRASLHNAGNVRRLGIGLGDEVLVSRRGDVIPYIEEVVKKVGAPMATPDRCAMCQSELSLEGEYLLCRNDDCPARVEGRIHNWIHAVDANLWGEKLVRALIEAGKVREPVDLYRITVDDIASLERHGKKSAQNALDQLHARLPLDLPTFLAGLGIEGFSTQTARLLVQAGHDDLDKILGATEEELAAIHGLGVIKAKNIVRGLHARAAEVARLRAAGVEPVVKKSHGPLRGKTFCITGSHGRSRKELTRLVEAAGGRVLSSVTKELDYLVIADPASTSSKAQKARELGTRLIDEAALVRLCEEATPAG
jgi:DNA ligase (NAD+)